MTEFLTRLVQRQSGEVPVVQPRQPSLYAMPLESPEFSTGQRPDEAESIGYSESGQSLGLRQKTASDRPEAAPRAIVSEDRQAESRGDRGLWRLEPSTDERPAQPPQVGPAAIVVRRFDEDRSDARVLIPPDDGARDRPIQIDYRTASPSRMRETAPLVHRDVPPTVHSREGLARLPTSVEVPPPRAESTFKRPRSQTASSAPPSLVTPSQLRGETGLRRSGGAEPPIQVTIGSIEVTAVSAALASKRKTAARQPAMSLQDYLARRQGKGVNS